MGRGPFWIAGSLAGLALAAVGWLAWSRLEGPVPTWDEVSREVAARRWPEAESKLERWIRAHPRQGQANLLLAKVRRSRDDRAGAIEALARVREPEKAWLEAQAQMGDLFMEQRRAADAEACFRRVVGRDPGAIEPRRRLVYLLSLQGRADEAREILWDIHRIVDDPRVLVDLVLELVKLREDIRGLGPELQEYLKATPDDPFLRRAWGMNLLYQGQPREALPHLKAAAAALEDDPEGRFALAECLLQLGMPVREDEVLGPAPESAAERSGWWLNRGRLAESLGRDDETVKAYREAVSLNPQNREALFRLGRLLGRLGQAAESRSQLDAYHRADERIIDVRREHARLRREGFADNPDLFARLGELCLRAGMIAEARAWFRHALKLDPGRSSLRVQLANLEAGGQASSIALARPRRKAQPGAGPPAPDVAPPTGTTGTRAEDGRLAFEDVAHAAGVDFTYDCGARGDLFLTDTMGGGVGLIDFDGDGLLDLYLVNSCKVPYDRANPPRPNRLFRNLGDFRFSDVTGSAGVAGVGCGMGCAVGDYDNDGDDDLFVTGYGGTILYRNRGDGTFEDVTERAGVGSRLWSTAAGFGDLDGDGDLDLVVVTYVDIDPAETPGCKDHSGHAIHCSPGRYPAQDDLLFRNEGNGRFTEVSKAAGFHGPEGRGLGLAIADLDDDGKLDVFVANDATPDFLFRNLGGWKFQEVASESGVATNGSGLATASMGVAADDLDGDGLLDLFITNFLNEPNSFFRGVGQGMYMDATLAAGLDSASRSKTGFGCAAIDADLDGQLDLFVADGHVDDQPWANSPMAQLPLLYRGKGGGRFELLGGGAGGYFERASVGRGVAAGDLDNDGRVDLVVVHRDAPVSILRNRTRGGHALGVRLAGGPSGRTPVGARVTCHAGGRVRTGRLVSGTGYLSGHDQRLWFGLGDAEVVDRLEVRWPSGSEQVFTRIPADRLVRIEEGSDAPKIIRELNSRR
ncbi:MAG: FG-GAP-like repeat-containing protein [Isosphaeraceae bacterium]